MAVMRPTNFLNWVPDPSSTNLATPPASISTVGFQPSQPLPAAWLNAIIRNLDQWTQYLAEGVNSTVLATSLAHNVRLVGGGTWSYASGTGALAWSAPFSLACPSAPDGDNRAAAGQVTLTAGQVAYVQMNLPYVTLADVTQGSPTIANIGYEAGIAVGQSVIGPGIPANATVVAVGTDTATLSVPATASGAQASLTFVGSGALTVQVADEAALIPGPNTMVIARCVGPAVAIGAGATELWLRDNEARSLLTAGYVTTVQAPAGVAIGALQLAYMSQGTADGRTAGSLYLCDASAANGAQRGYPVGFAHTATSSGSPCHVVQGGFLGGFSGLTPGAPYYANPSAPGGITATKPSAAGQIIAPVGVAVTPLVLLVHISAAVPVTQTFPAITVTGTATVGSVVSAAGIKSVVDLGSMWSSNYKNPTVLQKVVYNIGPNNAGSIGAIDRVWLASHSGSVLSLTGRLYSSLAENAIVLRLLKNTNTPIFLQVAPAVVAGAWAPFRFNFAKGAYPFAADDVLYAIFDNFATQPNFQADVSMTIELNA